MARTTLTSQQQVALLDDAQRQLGVNQNRLAALCRVHPRTLSDWQRGKTRMRYDVAVLLQRRVGMSFGRRIRQIPEYSHIHMAGRLGGLRRIALYGNPGTAEGRRRGGAVSVARRRVAGPAGAGRWVLAKPIREPRFSPQLAEFIGMMLGDGCLCSGAQAALYFNAVTDASYAEYMVRLAESLFDIRARRTVIAGTRGGVLIFSSKRLVDCLVRLGIQRGDKVVRQAGVPQWVAANRRYRRACLRGLMDTDGSVYGYAHTVASRTYRHVALCFTNRSRPILHFVESTLTAEGYHPTMSLHRVYLYRQEEIGRYFTEIGTHSAKHQKRYEEFWHRRGGSSPVEGAALEKR